MYFALFDQEKEAQASYCHFLIINVKKKKKKNPKNKNLFRKYGHKNAFLLMRDQKKVTNLAHKQCPVFLQENGGLEQKRGMVRGEIPNLY